MRKVDNLLIDEAKIRDISECQHTPYCKIKLKNKYFSH